MQKLNHLLELVFLLEMVEYQKKKTIHLNCSLNRKDTKVNVNKNIDICLKNLNIKKEY